jgi:Zn-finger domain-containing protein
MNESVLIGRAERFLAQIQDSDVELVDDTNSFLETFLETYCQLKYNLDTLYEFRDNMELKGYKAPYRSLKYGRVQSSEMKMDDLYDVSRHSQFFRMRAAAKKNILDRVKSGIASHKIALGHLEECAIVTCSSCQARYRGHELSKLNQAKCECGCSQFTITLNNDGIYRLGILKYLPLSGDYMVKMSELSPRGREAFRGLVRILKQEKRGIVKTLSMVIKIMEDGRWVRKRVNIDAQDQLNYERQIRETYGNNARIEFMQFHRKRPAIINDKHVQTALALGYVGYSESLGKSLLPQLLQQKLRNEVNLATYDASFRRVEDRIKVEKEWDEDGNLQEDLLLEILQKEGLADNMGQIDRDLKEDLQLRDKLQKEIFLGIPRALILWDLMRYYLSTSYDRRSKHSGPFPYLRPSLDINQLKAFQEFPSRITNTLKVLSDENIESLQDMDKIISFKFSMEKKTQGLHIKMDPAMGAAILNIKGQVAIPRAAQIFKVKPQDVKKQKSNLITLQKPATRKAQKFLELVQG